MCDPGFIGRLHFYHRDHLGSTGFVTAADATLYAHVQYFPSGEPWVDQRANTERLPYLLTDKELDQETGLYYFGARYYDPRTSLWQSPDPAQTEYLDRAMAGGLRSVLLSTYAYAAHNPLRFIDPDGRQSTYVQVWRWLRDDSLDWVQDGLDMASMALDGIGVGAAVSWAPDVLNASISGLREDWEGAIMSLGAALPGVGNVGNAARLSRSAAKRAKKAQKAASRTANAGPKAGRAGGPGAGKRATPRQRHEALGENNGKCVFCGEPAKEADHAIPRSRGGDTTTGPGGNLQPTCQHCNRQKGAKTSQEYLEWKQRQGAKE